MNDKRLVQSVEVQESNWGLGDHRLMEPHERAAYHAMMRRDYDADYECDCLS